MFDVILINGETWLICGGRDFHDEQMFCSAMGDLIRLKGLPARIVHGGAKGADALAGGWAFDHALTVCVEEADWELYGRSAGPIRNQAMLDKFKPTLVVAFPGGRGTADMIQKARVSGVAVYGAHERLTAASEQEKVI